jgi:hypothetical protein
MTSKTVSYTEYKLYITRIDDDVRVHSYPYNKITKSSRNRLDMLQFTCRARPVVLFIGGGEGVFTTYDYEGR